MIEELIPDRGRFMLYGTLSSRESPVYIMTRAKPFDINMSGETSMKSITLSEINRITHSFLDTLASCHQDRITYPGFAFNHSGVIGNGAWCELSPDHS